MKFLRHIPGLRSGNKRNKKIATTYYVLAFIIFMLGSSWKINDLFMLLILLLTPAIILNFKNVKNKKNHEGKKVFFITLLIYVFSFVGFANTAPPVTNEVEDSKVEVSSEKSDKKTNIKKGSSNTDKKTTSLVKTEEAQIHFINTGNSDAILIKQGNKAALIDAGDNDDESKVVSYLKEQGVSELEYVFATHPHADHIGGLDAVVNNIKINNLYVSNGDADTKTYRDFINAMANKGLSPSVPMIDSEFKLDSSTFKVLSVANSNEPNNNSLVLLYTNGSDKVLLMGDAEGEIESKINPGDVDLLKVGHHGSHSSSTKGFIDKVKAEYGVILVAKDNKYGHPHKETMDILESSGIKVHRSDECGNIVFKSSGNGLTTDCKEASYAYGSSTSIKDTKDSSNSNTNSSGGNTSENSNENNTAVVPTPTPAPSPKPEPQPEPETSAAGTVYANGGSSTSNKYHSSATAHNMEGAIPMSEGEAQSKGYVACKRCY